MPRYIDLDKLNEYPIRLNHYDKENGNVNFVYGIESVLEYANSLPVFETDVTQKWIPVKDKMPEEDVRVIVYSSIKTIGIAYQINDMWFTKDLLMSSPCNKITHWMPLPEPPKEK